jgi:hypothetical protein
MNVLRTLLVLVMLLLVATPEMRARSVDKINICHIEQRIGDELFGTVISIPVQAWPGHERHFDYQAPGLNVGESCGVIE